MITTTIVKWGNSQGIRLPKNLLEDANLTENDKVEIVSKNNEIIIKKAAFKKNEKIQDLFKNYNGTYEPITIDFGEPVGMEIW